MCNAATAGSAPRSILPWAHQGGARGELPPHRGRDWNAPGNGGPLRPAVPGGAAKVFRGSTLRERSRAAPYRDAIREKLDQRLTFKEEASCPLGGWSGHPPQGGQVIWLPSRGGGNLRRCSLIAQSSRACRYRMRRREASSRVSGDGPVRSGFRPPRNRLRSNFQIPCMPVGSTARAISSRERPEATNSKSKSSPTSYFRKRTRS